MDCRREPSIRRSPRGLRSLGFLAFCLSSSLSLPAVAAPPTPPTARSYLDEGLRLYNQGRYDAAVRQLRLGYALEPLSEFLYTLGQATRKLGHCDEAIGYYRQYLRSADATSAGAARFQIERCEQQLREAQALASARTSSPVVVTPPPRRRPFYRDPIGMTLASVGAASAQAGGGLLIGSALTLQHSRATFEQFDDTLSGAQTMRTTGIILASAGGALFVAGVIRLSLVARADRASGAR